MREIKFRAWDKENKIMADVHAIQINIRGVLLQHKQYENKIDEIICDRTFKSYDNIILMQYTGLKDKNGKEIYEGDIVKFTGGYNSFTNCLSPGYAGAKGSIIFLEKGYWGININKAIKGIPLYNMEVYEVIGNIYENPELIERI